MKRRAPQRVTPRRQISQALRDLGLRSGRFGFYLAPKRLRFPNDAALLVTFRVDRDLGSVVFRAYERGVLRHKIEMTLDEGVRGDTMDWLYDRVVAKKTTRPPFKCAADFATNLNIWTTTISAAAAQRIGAYERLRDEFLFCGCEPCRRNTLRLPEQHAKFRKRLEARQ